MSCSRTQHGGGRSRTPDLSLRSPTLYHWATALPDKILWDFYKITLELPHNSQKPSFKCKKFVTNTIKSALCLFLHKMCCKMVWKFCLFVCLCWGLTSQSTIFQSCRDGATASWVINQYFRGVKCLAQGHNTAAVGFEPPTSRSGVRHSPTEPPRSPENSMRF